MQSKVFNISLSLQKSKVCEILIPGYRMTTNYTQIQAEELENILKLMPRMTYKNNRRTFIVNRVSVFSSYGIENFSFQQTKICDFVNDPNLHAFGPKFYTLLKLRFNRGTMDQISAAVS